MGYLTVITMKGAAHFMGRLWYYHSACMFEVGSSRSIKWRGFHPRDGMRLKGRGEVDSTDLESDINHYVRFEVPDERLQSACAYAEHAWEGVEYVLGVRDCVSFTADVARACGLSVPPPPNMTPYGLLAALRDGNPHTHFDAMPYPWRGPS